MFHNFRRAGFRGILIVAILLGASQNSVLQASRVGVQIDVSIDFVALIQEVASWVKNAVGRYDAQKMERIRSSVPTLISQLTKLAGMKAALANYIASYDPQRLRPSQFAVEYRRNVKDINAVLDDVLATLAHLNVDWAAKNVDQAFEMRLAVSKKEAFMGRYGEIVDIHAEDLTALEGAYKTESIKLHELARALSGTLESAEAN